MIFGKEHNAQRVIQAAGLRNSKAWLQLIAELSGFLPSYRKGFNEAPLPVGDFEVKVVSLFEKPVTPPEFFESHTKNIDLHFCYEGTETIAVTDAVQLNKMEGYDPENDVTKYRLPEGFSPHISYVTLERNNFLILFPNDVHRPLIRATTDTVSKVVAKVPVAMMK